jgi:hypothetical protein
MARMKMRTIVCMLSLVISGRVYPQDSAEIIKSKDDWSQKIVELLARSKQIDREIYYCHTDISLFGDHSSLNCALARGRINIISYRSNMGTIPEDDTFIVSSVCEAIYKLKESGK